MTTPPRPAPPALRIFPPDDILWTALTVWQEASGEPYEGKLAVAYVIFRRAGSGSVSDAVLKPWQFSAWNTDSPTRSRLDSIDPGSRDWLECYRAAVSAAFGFEADPSKGANFYLNVEATRQIRGGTLPKWAADPKDPTQIDESKVTAKIGRHTFLK